VVKSVVEQTRILIRFPRCGRKVPEFDDENIRELIAYSYRIIYRLDEDDVLIAAIIHGEAILALRKAARVGRTLLSDAFDLGFAVRPGILP
jgi:plasmid stabilization system protein ParE